MKKKYSIFILVLLLSISLFAQNEEVKKSKKLDRPKLVIGIVIDQMRWDYLYRYYDRYSENGFKRLLREGFSCNNTQINYIPTFTAVGHSSIYTGSIPAIHGIAGNDFIIQATGKSIYCTEDPTVETVGSNSKAGQMSPRNLLTTTITDELRLATNFHSKVIGIALKDRGGILPAGHTANAAYWFDDKTGNWITSSYYMKNLPNWLVEFNNKKLVEKYLKQDWNLLYSPETYQQSTEDNNKYEGKFKGTPAATLPVKTSSLYQGNPGLIRATPMGNTFAFDMAKAAINGENMGQVNATDFLALSLSSTDYIGHQFGINAIETEDTYLKLDLDLADFLSYLDAKVGRGKYTLFLTADHGAAHNTAFLNDHGIPGNVWNDQETLNQLNEHLENTFGHKKIVLSLGNYQVNLNNPLIKEQHLNEDKIINNSILYLKALPFVQFAIEANQIEKSPIPEPLKSRIINGYNYKNSGVIQIILNPGWFTGHQTDDGGPTGTTHGTWNPYDNHIPLLFMGWGIQHGSSVRETNMTDIAPTIAALLHIQNPSGSIGKPIDEIIK